MATNGSQKQTEYRNPDGTISADGLLSIASDAIKQYGVFAGGRMMQKLGVTNPTFLENAAYIHVRSLTKKEYSA